MRLTAGGTTQERVVRVEDDPRFHVDPSVRARWTADLREITATLMAAQLQAREVRDAARSIEEGGATPAADVTAKVKDLDRELEELVSRLARLRSGAEDWVGPLSADQASQKAFLADMLETLGSEWRAVQGRVSG